MLGSVLRKITPLNHSTTNRCLILSLTLERREIKINDFSHKKQYKQARSQDLEKGGGFFERVRKVQTTLTRIFIVLESVSRFFRKLRRNFSESSAIQTFIPPKNRWKRSSPKLRLNFRPKSEIQTFFQPKSRWSPKKKKKSSPKLRLIFWPESEIQTLFHTDSQNLLHNFGTQFPLGGGCFQFFTKNRPQKHQIRAILHTSQANGGALAPPPPPPLATLLNTRQS